MNAYLLYKSSTSDRVPVLHRQFRQKLVHGLVSSVDKENIPGMKTKAGRLSVCQEPLMRLQGKHFPEKIVGKGKKKNVTRACVVCEPAEKKILEQVGQ